jgi:tetratricopeptide (TPR) repeat protein
LSHCRNVDELKRERIAVLNSLAAHFAGLAAAESDATERDRLFAEATTQLNKADTVDGSHPLALVGKGAVMLARGDLGRAQQLFSVAANYSKGRSVPALLGQACVSFLRDQFHDALKGYRRALEQNPAAPANVRLGLALSFHALNRPDAARAAFERVLQLDPNNADALVGLAVLTLNTGIAAGTSSSAAAPVDAHQAEEHVRSAMALVKRAYAANPRSAAVLIQLANHFFYRKEYNKTMALAQKALHSTQAPRARAEACFQIARAHHAQDDLDKALQYYQQATKLQADHPLALYGLGQAHMHRNEDDAALACFEKVLKAFPDNWEVMFAVGSLLANKRDARDRARTLLQRSSELRPNDANVWLRYAQHLEALADYAASLQAYRKGAALLQRAGERVPAEVHNNIAVLASMQGVHDEATNHALLALGAMIVGDADVDDLAERARAYFDALVDQTRASADVLVADIDAAVAAKLAAKRTEQQAAAAAAIEEGEDGAVAATTTTTPETADSSSTATNAAQRTLAMLRSTDNGRQHHASATPVTPPLNGSLVTALYNFARTSEAGGRLRDAADGYLALLVTHRHYVDAWVRLGVMARDAGELDHADAWWECVHKTARNHAETRCLQGNLHLQRGALLAAQKAFERVLATVDKDDAYATLALGNIYYIAHFDKRDEARSLRQLEHAWQHYWGALQRDPRNACAANGVALVLAEKQYFSEAKDFFFQVREAVADNPSVWINLAHVQMRQGQFVAAAKTYAIASRKYFEDRDPQVLMWMARAYFEDNKFAQAKRLLQDALHLAPGDPLVRFNLALALESHAVATLRVDTRSLQDARDALFELDAARREFETLAQRRGATVTIGAVSGVGAARTTALITKNSARHEKYCANTRHEVEKRVNEAEAAERLRLQQLSEQQERLQQQAAQRAHEEADRLAAAERAKEEEQRQIEEDLEKMRELRDTWQHDEAKKSKNAPKRKRKGRDDEDDDPLDGIAEDGTKAKASASQKAANDDEDAPYNPGDSLAPAEEVPPAELPLEEDEASFHEDDDGDDDNAGGEGSGDERRARHKKLRSMSKKKRAVRKTTTAAAEHKAMAAAVADANEGAVEGAADARPRRRLKRRKEGDEDEDDNDTNNANNITTNNNENEVEAVAAAVDEQ